MHNPGLTVTTGTDDNYKVAMYSLSGQQMFASTFTSTTELDVQHLADGMYIIRLTNLTTGKRNQTKVVLTGN